MSGLAAAAAAAAAAPLVDVAVVGGGFGGMATAWHLAKKGIVNNTRVTVFDRDLPGRGGASSVAAGILHPLTPRGKLIWRGEEGMQSAMELVQVRKVKSCLHAYCTPRR
jgi:glycine/D-amino acid oxidase-like deaminating enzyme